MIVIKDTQALKKSSDTNTLSSLDTNEKKSASSMFDNMIKDVTTEQTTQEATSSENKNNSHIQIITTQQQLTQELEQKIKNLLNKTTDIDKLKFIKTNQELLANATTLDQLKEVAKNLKLNLSKVAQTENIKSTKPTIIAQTENIKSTKPTLLQEQLMLKAKLSTQMPTTKSIILKGDENIDIPIKKDFENQLQNSTVTVSQLKEKIFDSKQKIQSFMSDIAKQMAQNYKPPLTALKISLHPKELGSIDVVLRGTKNNINITFQSNPITMDILTQNQGDLRGSLNKQFGEDQAFSFNFSQNQQQTKENEFKNILFEDEDILDEDIVDLDINLDNDIYL